MRMKKAGFAFIEGAPKPGLDRLAERGKRHDDEWEPYKLWVGDLWECPGCDARILSGFANQPVAERHHSYMAEWTEKLHAELLVKDC